MLTITDTARDVIHDLTHLPQVPEGAAVRIAPVEGAERLEISLVTAPQDGDEILEAGDSQVYIEQEASAMLAEQVLDAQPSEQGPQFVIAART